MLHPAMQMEIILLNEIKKQECIYNPKCPDYGKQDVVDAAWAIIASRTVLPVKVCKQEWDRIKTFLQIPTQIREKMKQPFYMPIFGNYFLPFLKPKVTLRISPFYQFGISNRCEILVKKLHEQNKIGSGILNRDVIVKAAKMKIENMVEKITQMKSKEVINNANDENNDKYEGDDNKDDIKNDKSLSSNDEKIDVNVEKNANKNDKNNINEAKKITGGYIWKKKRQCSHAISDPHDSLNGLTRKEISNEKNYKAESDAKLAKYKESRNRFLNYYLQKIVPRYIACDLICPQYTDMFVKYAINFFDDIENGILPCDVLKYDKLVSYYLLHKFKTPN